MTEEDWRNIYVGMDGEPITVEEWGRLYEDFPARVLAEEPVGGVLIRTVWTGIKDGDIHPFGTAEVAANYRLGKIKVLREYDTRAEALAGHRAVVEGLRGVPE